MPGMKSEARPPRAVRRVCLTAMPLLVAALAGQPAHAAVQGGAFQGLEPMAEHELAGHRGGMKVGGMEFTFAVDVTTTVEENGRRVGGLSTRITRNVQGEVQKTVSQVNAEVERVQDAVADAVAEVAERVADAGRTAGAGSSGAGARPSGDRGSGNGATDGSTGGTTAEAQANTGSGAASTGAAGTTASSSPAPGSPSSDTAATGSGNAATPDPTATASSPDAGSSAAEAASSMPDDISVSETPSGAVAALGESGTRIVQNVTDEQLGAFVQNTADNRTISTQVDTTMRFTNFTQRMRAFNDARQAARIADAVASMTMR